MTDQTTLNPSSLLQTTEESPKPRADRVELDAAARRLVIALLTNGSSRRTAARYVGCAPSTITRAAQRDPEFAAELVRAETTVEIQSLQAIRNAAKSDRYWRAAAWLLERKNPADFGPQSDGFYTAADVFHLLSQVLASLRERIPDPERDRAVDHLGALLLEFQPGLPKAKESPKD